MKRMMFVALTGVSLAIAGAGVDGDLGAAIQAPSTTQTIQEPTTHKSFPTTVTITDAGKEYTLQITGMTLRKKYLVKVYAMAHYMEDTPNGADKEIYQAILTDGKAKQTIVDWARGASLEQMKGGYIESFHHVLEEEEFHAMRKEFDRFMSFYRQDVVENDRHVLRWLPGSTVELIVNDESRGRLTHPAFVKALWSTWFSPQGVLDREDLISMIDRR